MEFFKARTDEDYMRLALNEARKASKLGEVPIGAIVTDPEGNVVARAHNQVELLKDGTAHAEMLALSIAQASLGDWRLEGHSLYVTKEPCPMCAGAIINCRVFRVIVGCSDPKFGATGSWINLLDSNPPLNHRCEVTLDVLKEECLYELQSFFRQARTNRAKSAAAKPTPDSSTSCCKHKSSD